MLLTPPPVVFNDKIAHKIKTTKLSEQKYMMCDLEVLGEGAAGTTYSAYLKPKEDYPEMLVLKEQRRTGHAMNELEALKFLKQEMLAEKIPGYFVFFYGSFSSGNKKYFIIEHCDVCLVNHMTDYNLTTRQFLNIFYHIANAVACLEKYNFNHGDLWVENVMLSWKPDQEHLQDDEKDFWIKIIDFDSAFKKDLCTNPSLGGADEYRSNFILGYDLSRFFDSLLYAYNSYIEKKIECKKQKIAKLIRQKKKNKNIIIPSIDDYDSCDEAYDADNVIYPPEILKFMQDLKPSDPGDFSNRKDMSGEEVCKKILTLAKKLDISLE